MADPNAEAVHLKPLYNNFNTLLLRSPEHEQEQKRFTEQNLPNSEMSKDNVLFYSYTLAENNNQRFLKIAQELAKSPFVSYDAVCQMAGKNQVSSNHSGYKETAQQLSEEGRSKIRSIEGGRKLNLKVC